MVGSQICTKGLKEVGLIWPEAGKGEEQLNNYLQLLVDNYEKMDDHQKLSIKGLGWKH